MSVLPDPSTPFGQRVRERLSDEAVAWLTTVGEPPPHRVDAYVAEYGDDMAAISGSLKAFGDQYPVPLRVRPLRVRGF